MRILSSDCLFDWDGNKVREMCLEKRCPTVPKISRLVNNSENCLELLPKFFLSKWSCKVGVQAEGLALPRDGETIAILDQS